MLRRPLRVSSRTDTRFGRRPSSQHIAFAAPQARCYINRVLSEIEPGHRVRSPDRSKYSLLGSAFFGMTISACSQFLFYNQHECPRPNDHTTCRPPSRPPALSRCLVQYAYPNPFTSRSQSAHSPLPSLERLGDGVRDDVQQLCRRGPGRM